MGAGMQNFEQNKINQGEYNTCTGQQIRFRKITTFLNRWIFDVINKADYNVLENVFAHLTIFLNGIGITPSELPRNCSACKSASDIC